MRIAFDETHAESWTIDLALAKRLDPYDPEYHYYGHVATLMQLSAGAEVVAITEPWSRELLRQNDVVVLVHPSDPVQERGCPGSPTLTAAEITLLQEYVHSGGGLLILNEAEPSRYGSNLNELLEPLGLRFNDDTLRVPHGGAASYLLVRHFRCVQVTAHEITRDIKAITYHRGCSVTATSSHAMELVRAPRGQAVVAVATHGRGRVAIVGDTDVFAIPFIGHADNATLLLNMFDWLSQSERNKSAADIKEFVRERAFPLLEPTANRDLKQVQGSHIVDCSPYAAEFERLAAGMPNPYKETEKFLEEAELRFHELPRPVRTQIVRFRVHGNEHGAIVLTGLPVDPDLPDTPIDSRRTLAKQTFFSETWLAMFGGAVGDPMAYSQEKDGELFQTVAPTRKNEKELSSESSSILLDFHTETAFHPYMPDYLLLYCVRADHERVAETILSSTRLIVAHLPLKHRAVLFDEAYRTGIDYSFGSQSGIQGNGPLLAVLSGNWYDPYMKFDLDLMKPEHEEAAAALAALKQVANEVKEFVKLEPGDLLLVDNRKAVHGRSLFVPKYDGKDRWLQRLVVTVDLGLSEGERRRHERIIDLEFTT